ncbi:basic helix-loop-helix family protein [Klebsormidium nitens]|uniref:Basic helix-loop-helix family protein n=1 Tax=Klebsormidium nitens TaxID=105231 RepID=A0A1Y1HL72_KLENI|nr:basic helix-loop-helix family protein [Klebsormidium nitens]|eukprot:GAQ78392.1 basic helix-loop-helix family protein [Klebsormidium nitens]
MSEPSKSSSQQLSPREPPVTTTPLSTNEINNLFEELKGVLYSNEDPAFLTALDQYKHDLRKSYVKGVREIFEQGRPLSFSPRLKQPPRQGAQQGGHLQQANFAPPEDFTFQIEQSAQQDPGGQTLLGTDDPVLTQLLFSPPPTHGGETPARAPPRSSISVGGTQTRLSFQYPFPPSPRPEEEQSEVPELSPTFLSLMSAAESVGKNATPTSTSAQFLFPRGVGAAAESGITDASEASQSASGLRPPGVRSQGAPRGVQRRGLLEKTLSENLERLHHGLSGGTSLSQPATPQTFQKEPLFAERTPFEFVFPAESTRGRPAAAEDRPAKKQRRSALPSLEAEDSPQTRYVSLLTEPDTEQFTLPGLEALGCLPRSVTPAFRHSVNTPGAEATSPGFPSESQAAQRATRTEGAKPAMVAPIPIKMRAKRGCATERRSVSERERRERIAARMDELRALVPQRMAFDKTSMLAKIVEYVKFLQMQVQLLRMGANGAPAADVGLPGGLPEVAKGLASRLPHPGQDPGVATGLLHLLKTAPGEAVQFLHDRGLCLVPTSVAATRFAPRGQLPRGI